MGLVEREVVTALQKIFATADSRLKVGIGDDAAVVATQSQSIITSDMAVEDVHFKLAWSTPFEIGAKLTTANLADLFAMGATPKYLLVAAGLPTDLNESFIADFAKGIRSVADKFSVAVVGGDLSKSAKVVLTITAFGDLVGEPVTRSGAQVEDHIYVSELPGLSAAGHAILNRGLDRPRYVVQAHLNPKLVPPIQLIQVATAMCDISDGISIDGSNIAQASKVNFSLDKELISAASGFNDLAELAKELSEDVFDWILNGGEDHFFLATVNPQKGIELPAIKIGEVVAGEGKVLLDGAEIKRAGYQHF